MKKFYALMAAFAIIAFAVPAFALGNTASRVPFSNISGASAAVKTSDVVNVSGYKTKSLTVSGVDLAGTGFKNMSGTVVAQCGPSPTGPWSTCLANDYAQTSISRTTNGLFTWSDAVAYVRLQWTSGTVGGKLKAWLNLIEY